MSINPTLNPQIIGQVEHAHGAVMEQILAGTGHTFRQWVALTLIASSGDAPGRDQLAGRMAGALKIEQTVALRAIDELTDAQLVEPASEERPGLTLTSAGRRLHQDLRGQIDDAVSRLYRDIPVEDLETAARVLLLITSRANSELAGT